MRIKLKTDINKGKTTLRAGKTTSLARHNKFKADNSEE